MVDGEKKEIDVPAKIINNRTLIPLRAISDAYECVVEWDSVLKTAGIYETDFYNAPKKDFEGRFKYFADVNFSQSGNTASRKSGECALTFEKEPFFFRRQRTPFLDICDNFFLEKTSNL